MMISSTNELIFSYSKDKAVVKVILHDHVDIVFLEYETFNVQSSFNFFIFLINNIETFSSQALLKESQIAKYYSVYTVSISLMEWIDDKNIIKL